MRNKFVIIVTCIVFILIVVGYIVSIKGIDKSAQVKTAEANMPKKMTEDEVQQILDTPVAQDNSESMSVDSIDDTWTQDEFGYHKGNVTTNDNDIDTNFVVQTALELDPTSYNVMKYSKEEVESFDTPSILYLDNKDNVNLYYEVTCQLGTFTVLLMKDGSWLNDYDKLQNGEDIN